MGVLSFFRQINASGSDSRKGGIFGIVAGSEGGDVSSDVSSPSGMQWFWVYNHVVGIIN